MGFMLLEEKLQKSSVIGAAGKMGSGIALLLLLEILRTEADKYGIVGTGRYILNLIDANEEALFSLKQYLREQVQKYAEKNINQLRKYFANQSHLVSNKEHISAFIEGGMECIRMGTEMELAEGSYMVFEAIVEDIEIKGKVLGTLNQLAENDAYFFTNTSSIPIHVLGEKSGLHDRIIGYHFYNPPAVQHLLEIIPAETNDQDLIKLAKELGERLGKVVVLSKDIAGFIGNGHFIREIDFTLRKVKDQSYSLEETIVSINRLTSEFLLRPMGIFQLIDYVGIDVCQKVMKIMSTYLKIQFESELIDRMVEKGIIGGQHPDGSQKNGFFSYHNHQLEKVYSFSKEGYINLPMDFLGELPEGHTSWKELHKMKHKKPLIENYLKNLFSSSSVGGTLAQEYLKKSRDIARGLVTNGVAKSIDDVNTVIINGFYHVFGPDSPLIPEHISVRSSS